MEEKLEKIKRFIDKYQDTFGGIENKEVNNWETIKELVDFFLNHEARTPIVDFIDTSNWDCVERFKFNDEDRMLELVWHDFRKDADKSKRNYFDADLIKADIKIDSVVVVTNKGIPVLFIKAYYQEQKKLNILYNKGCSKMTFLKSHPFSTEIDRIIKHKREITIIPNINCFTVAIVPDCARFLSAHDSKELLYSYNISSVSEQLLKIMDSVGKLDESDQEDLLTLGNSARKLFENVLKVLNLQKKTSFEKDYQKLMLGDLIPILKDLSFLDGFGINLKNVVDTLNKCSHDAGVFIKKDEVYISLIFILASINLN